MVTLRYRRVLLACCCLLLFAAKLLAQDSPPPPPPSCPEQCPYLISGVVLNAATGAPITRALVQATGSVETAAMTDDSGRFRLEGLPSGHFAVGASRPGFIAGSGPRGVPQRAKYVTVGAETPTVTIKLVPQAVIQGTVTDSSGVPVEAAPVRIMKLTSQSGRLQWMDMSPEVTDAQGHFRAADLPAGKYCVAVRGSTTPGLAPPGHVSQDSWGYSAAYFPCEGRSTNSALDLKMGQQAEANLQVHLTRYFTVSGTVDERSRQGEQMMLQLMSRSETSSPQTVSVEPNGKFHSGPVPPGDYILTGVTYGQKRLRADMPVKVNANVSDVHLVLEPMMSIPVVVHADQLPPEVEGQNAGVSLPREQRPLVSINLSSADGSSAGAAGVAGESSSALNSVGPGTFRAFIQSMDPRLYVESASHGSTDLLRDDFVVSPGADRQPIYIVLRSGCAKITGKILGELDSATAVVAVPEDGKQSHIDFVQPTPDGAFAMPCVAPGSYTVRTIADPDLGEIYDNAIPDSSSGVHVLASAGQESSVNLNVSPQGED